MIVVALVGFVGFFAPGFVAAIAGSLTLWLG